MFRHSSRTSVIVEHPFVRKENGQGRKFVECVKIIFRIKHLIRKYLSPKRLNRFEKEKYCWKRIVKFFKNNTNYVLQQKMTIFKKLVLFQLVTSCAYAEKKNIFNIICLYLNIFYYFWPRNIRQVVMEQESRWVDSWVVRLGTRCT